MKLSLIALALFSTAALAGSIVEGEEAEKLFAAIEAKGAVITENSICVTTLELDDITCTMIGSHDSCGRDQETICTIQ